MPLRIIDVFLYLIICLGATDLGSILCWWIFGRVSSPYNWINASIGLDAAKEFKVKSLEMVMVKDLLAITGYVRGGCSPIGMKKAYPTIVDITALSYDKIIFSGGKIGVQIEMNPNDLNKIIRLDFKDIRRD